MKFSSHIGKGVWALASRGLPMIYAVVLVFIARQLPVEEFGSLSIFQVLFAIIFTFADNFVLQAVVKYGAEPDADVQEVVTSASALLAIFVVAVSLILWAGAGLWSALLNSPSLPTLVPLMLLLILVSAPRTLFAKVLQMKFRVKELFWVDFANFGVAAVILAVLLFSGKIHSASDVVHVTIITGGLASLLSIVLMRRTLAPRLQYSREMMSKVMNFGKYQVGTGLASMLAGHFDTLLVSHYTGASGVAVYGIAKQQLYRIFDVVRDTQTLFIFPVSSKYHASGDIEGLRKIFEKAISFLYLLLIPMAIVLYILTPQILHLLYQGKYDSATPIFRALLGTSLILPVQMIFSTATVGFGRMKSFFRIMLVSFTVNLGSAYVLLPMLGATGGAIAFGLGLATQAIQFYYLMKREVGFRPRNLLLQGPSDLLNFVKGLISRRVTS